MAFSFRPAKRSEAKPLIGLYAESGAGKTLSALLLARGFAGPTGKVGMIETESGRGEAYADDPRVPGGYHVLSLREDFGPRMFGEAIAQAEKEELDALIIDSASHEWDATGGVRHLAAINEEEGKKGMLVWQTPKMEHQRHFMLPLLSTPIPLVILCMRARYPMEENPTKKGDWKRAEHLVPYQSDTILFEMFAHGWIDRQHRFHGTKWTRDELRAVLRDNEPISLETGQRLAAWAKGSAPSTAEGNTAMAGTQPAPAVSVREPGATSGGGTGGTPTAGFLYVGDLTKIVPEGTPVDDWVGAFGAVTTLEAGTALWKDAQKVKGSFTAREWLRIVVAKNDAKERLVVPRSPLESS